MDDKTVITTVGQRIRTARISAGLTQTQLAEKAQCTRSAINKWEKIDMANIPCDTAIRIAMACNVNVRWVVGFIDDPQPWSRVGQDEAALLESFRQLSPQGRDTALSYTNFLVPEERSHWQPVKPTVKKFTR